MPHIAICEDDMLQSEIIYALLNKYQAERPELSIQSCSFDSGEPLLRSIENGDKFDLFLLDIMLPGMNGIEVAKELRKKHVTAPLVFLTSSADYALDAVKIPASQYILKPVRHNQLFPILDKIINNLK